MCVFLVNYTTVSEIYSDCISFKFSTSVGIGPVSSFPCKCRTLSFFKSDNVFGIEPVNLLLLNFLLILITIFSNLWHLQFR